MDGGAESEVTLVLSVSEPGLSSRERGNNNQEVI